MSAITPRRGERPLNAAIAVAALIGIVLELTIQLSVAEQFGGPAQVIVRFFSYFTILSNLLVAAACGLPLLGRPAGLAAFFARPRVRAGVAIYIVVTGAVYALLLAGTWQPEGLMWVANALLHYVVPPLYVLAWLWLSVAPRPRLSWSDTLRWLLFPAAYLGWILLRGAWMKEYPYPFVDVTTLGMAAVLRNAAALMVLFVLLGLVFVGVDKLAGRRVADSEAAR